MRHPTELLADHVDGTLAERERLEVEAHLATCAQCRAEVELAGAVVPALRDLPEEPVPLGVTSPVLERAGQRGWSSDPQRARHRSRRPIGGWALGGAVAASVVLLLAVVLREGAGGIFASGGGGGAVEAASSPSTNAAHRAATVPVERQDRNYDPSTARALGQTTKDAAFAQATLSGGGAPAASPTPAPGAAPMVPSQTAIACLRKAGATFSDSDRLVRLILARYQGQPAYLGVFLEGPPGRRADTVVVWVVGANDCGVRLLTSERV